MISTASWKILSMQSIPNNEVGHLVTRVYFMVEASALTASGQTMVSSISPFVDIVAQSPTEHYDDLTEEKVISWVQASFGEMPSEMLEETVIKNVADKILAADRISLALPWATVA